MYVLARDAHELVQRVSYLVKHDVFAHVIVRRNVQHVGRREDLFKQFVFVLLVKRVPRLFALLGVHPAEVLFVLEIDDHVVGDVDEVAGRADDAFSRTLEHRLDSRVVRGEFIQDHDAGQRVLFRTEKTRSAARPFYFVFEFFEVYLSLLDTHGEIGLVDSENTLVYHLYHPF